MSDKAKAQRSALKVSNRKLQAMIWEATADAHDEDEARMGFHSWRRR
jgi:hypothetical protein